MSTSDKLETDELMENIVNVTNLSPNAKGSLHGSPFSFKGSLRGKGLFLYFNNFSYL